VIDSLLDRFRRRDRLALARLLSLAARGEALAEIRSALPPPAQPARVVALTGSGGVGKSTLVGKLIEHLRGQGQKVAVLACDPQSPLSGGALLGDRFRMPTQPDDDGVFIRSLATRGGHGAVAEHLDLMVRLLEGFGFDVVLIETVGSGQGDTAVRELADVVVLLLQPETGDDLQWEKAGVLEVADVVAIHKADLPGAEQAAAQVRASLDLAGTKDTPVVRVSSKTGEGVAALWQAVEACPRRRAIGADSDRELLALAQELLGARFARARAVGDGELTELLEQWRQGAVAGPDAGAAVLRLLSAAGPENKLA
jgi:LAO/AO transport system ATPase